MEKYIVNILCDFCLLLVIRRFIDDFFGKRKRSKNWSNLASIVWLAGTLVMSELFHVPLLNLTTNLLLTILLTYAYEGSVVKRVLVSILLSVLSAACDMVAFVTTSAVLDPDKSFYSFVFTVIYMLLLERILGIVIRRGRVWELVGKEMLLLCGFPVLAVIVLYCVTAMESGIYQCIASIAVLAISILYIVVYDKLAMSLEVKWEKGMLEKSVEAYHHELDTMKNSQRRIQNLRHDLRHHFIELEGLAKQGKNEEIYSYVKELETSFADTKRAVHTGEYETDSLVNFLVDDARNRAVDVCTDITIPEDLNVSKYKWNVIVGNLLENAIEAASKADMKKVILKLKLSDGILFLEIKNSYTGRIVMEDGMVKAKSVARNHGIGLRSVKELVDEQDGQMDIKVDDEWFDVKVMISIV